MDIATLTDDEARDLLGRVYADVQRRDTLAQAPAQAEALAATYAAAIGRKDGDPWTQPVGAHDAHRQGAIVTHGGQHYRSTRSGNVWRPGDLNAPWEPVWPDGGEWTTTPPAGEDGWPAAWMSGVAYQPGDRVTHDGQTWEAKIAHTSHDGWKPSPATHAVWAPIS